MQNHVGRWLAGFVVLAVLVACDKPPDIRRATNAIVFEPESLDFGPLATGHALEAWVEAKHVGSVPLQLDAIEIEGGGPFTVTPALDVACDGTPRAEPRVVDTGDCVKLLVAFRPTAAESFTGAVRISFAQNRFAPATLPLRGRGVRPLLRACVLDAQGRIDERSCSRPSETPPQPASVQFGPVPTDVVGERTLRLENLAEVPFDLASLTFDATETSFTTSTPFAPLRLEAGATVDLGLELRPARDGVIESALTIVPGDETAAQRVLLSGEGKGPRLCVVPEEGLAFGDVPIGAGGAATLTFRNCGPVRYPLEEIAFAPGVGSAEAFGVGDGDIPEVPWSFQQGGELRLHVTFAPPDVGDFSATARVRTPFGEVSLPIAGRGIAPDCARRRPVANAGPDRGVAPLTAVTLDAGASAAPYGGITYDWRLLARPEASSAVLDTTAGLARFEADVAGTYEAELVVRDRYGCESAPDRVVVQAAPRSLLYTELTWDTDGGDLDLHWVGPGGVPFEAPGDVFWRNVAPDWSDASSAEDGETANDPRFEREASWGRGPEGVAHDAGADASYDVFVHHRCERPFEHGSYGARIGPSTARVRLFLNGQVLHESTRLLSEGEVWHAATVAVGDDTARVTITPGPDESLPSPPSERCVEDAR